MPDWKNEIRKHLVGLNLSAAREDEIIEELSQHLDDRYHEMLASGVRHYEAYRTALIDIASNELLERELRRIEHRVYLEPVVFGVRRRNMIEAIWQDIRYGIRMLIKNPGFTAVALISLALGIGANTAIFQLIDAIRMKTLPVRNPQEIVDVHITDMSKARGSRNSWHETVNNPAWEQIRDRQQVFNGIFAWGAEGFDISASGESRNAQGLYVSGGFFPTLDVKPALGRLFTEQDDRRGCSSPGAVISYSFWQKEYGGQSSALGQKIMLNHHSAEIIGVSQPGFFGLEVGQSYDIAVPVCWEATVDGESNILDSSTDWWLIVMGRLKPGVSVQQASAQMNAISPGVFENSLTPKYPKASINDYLAFKLAAYPAGNGISSLRQDYSKPLWMLLAIAGLVLLIACANLANLMLARASAREQEIGVRLALGASRSRLIVQLLAESLLLAGVGAILGAMLAQLLSTTLVKFIDTKIELDADWRVLGFTAGIAILTCILFGLVPAIRATGINVGAVIKGGNRTMSAGGTGFGLRRILVVSQVALSLVLLVGALLFTRTLHNLLTVDTGFQQNGVLVVGTNFARISLPVERRISFKRELLEKLRTTPGVESAAEANLVPLGGSSWGNSVWMESSDPSQKKGIHLNNISSDYFKTLGGRIIAGRDFNLQDTIESPKVAIVNEAFAKSLLNGENPVGKRFWREATPTMPEMQFEIVGLVKNQKYDDLKEDFPPIAYMAATQDTRPRTFDQIIVRSSLPLTSLTPGIKNTITNINPDIAISFDSLQTMVSNTVLQEQLMASLSGFFGILAAMLATVGLYGVMSYSVLQRKQEIGIRVALGANRKRIMGMVMRESTLLLAIGLMVGGVISIFVSKFAAGLLFGLQPNDPSTLAMAGALLAAVAIAASFLPARRAASVDPMIALRNE